MVIQDDGRKTRLRREVFRSALGIEQTPFSRIKEAFLAVLIFAAFLAFVDTVRDNYTFSGADLRNRVVGARALLQGLDPYFYEWKQDMSDRLLDPRMRRSGPTRVTVNPIVLFMYATTSSLPYRIQRRIWFFLEWGAFVGSVFLLAASLKKPKVRYVFLCVALLFFACAYFWRLHLERGQYYVFLLALLSCACFIYTRRDSDSLLMGLPLGISALFRPVVLPITVLFFILRLRRAAISMVTVFVAGLILSISIVGIGTWQSFFKATKYVSIGEGYRKYYERFGPKREVPTIAEGCDFSHILESKGLNTSLFGVVNRYVKPLMMGKGIVDWASFLEVLLKVCLAFIVFIFITFLIIARMVPVEAQLSHLRIAIPMLGYVNFEYFIPVRYSYVDVLLMLPVALLLPRLLRTKRRPFSFAIVLCGLLCGLLFMYIKGTLLRNVLVTLTLDIVVIREVLREAAEARQV